MSFKVLFVCGSLEPSKNGVADYIHCLAHELARQGFQCACIALNDPYVSSTQPDAALSWRYDEVQVKRLSTHIAWKVKTDVLKAEIQALNPDWISFHYCAYSYHQKGLPFVLIRCLIAVNSLAKWQIMAHELWVDPSTGLRNRLLSSVQQLIARRLFALIRPKVIHVTNNAYQSMLSGCGIESKILPLFSAIPFCYEVSPAGQSISQWSFVLFGSISRDWKPELLLEQIELARVRHGIEACRFISVGNAGDYGEMLWDSLASSNHPTFSFSRLGELPAELVSEQLQLADFGISVMPSHLVGKSSSVAAMVSHGLPVIITRLSQNCDQLHQLRQQTGNFILLDSLFSSALASASKSPPVNSLEATARQFVRDLEHAACR